MFSYMPVLGNEGAECRVSVLTVGHRAGVSFESINQWFKLYFELRYFDSLGWNSVLHQT